MLALVPRLLGQGMEDDCVSLTDRETVISSEVDDSLVSFKREHRSLAHEISCSSTHPSPQGHII